MALSQAPQDIDSRTRWSNCYLHVEMNHDTRRTLRALRSEVAASLNLLRLRRNAARQSRDAAIFGSATYLAAIALEAAYDVSISEVQRIAEVLR